MLLDQFSGKWMKVKLKIKYPLCSQLSQGGTAQNTSSSTMHLTPRGLQNVIYDGPRPAMRQPSASITSGAPLFSVGLCSACLR